MRRITDDGFCAFPIEIVKKFENENLGVDK